ncbi:MAG TPA: addiction module protein [Gemmataceae bacterium]|nr:addiction module protein [Gemmataceae bacterium]
MKTLDEVLHAAFELSDAERRELVESLVATLDSDNPVLSEAWLAEIKRRSDAYDAGHARTFTWEDVKESACNEQTL